MRSNPKRLHAMLGLLVIGSVGASGCASMNKQQEGAVIGAATGATVGGVIGNQTGPPARGATIAAVVGGAQPSALFRFMDSDGVLLALVGERTVSVARVVATQLREGPFPLRLCYAGPVLRNQPLNAGRRRESLQAGCELLGATGLAADAECIALAAAALERGGVEHIQVDVGHADSMPGLLDSERGVAHV